MPWSCRCPGDVSSKLNQVLQSLAAIGKNQGILGQNQVQMTYLQKELGRKLDRLTALVFSQVMPDCFTVTLISERKVEDMDILKYRTDLSLVPLNTDTKEQKFVALVDGAPVVIEGVTQEPQILPKDATFVEFEVPQDANVEVRLTYLDNATPQNESAAASQSFVANDTIGPEAPGGFGAITLISEREVPDPA